MGKYTKLKDKLPKFEIAPDWKVAVDEAKKAYIALDTADMARHFNIQREAKRHHEKIIKDINTELEALSQLLVSDLEGSSLQKVQLTTGETGYLQDEPYSSVEDKDKLMDWVKRKKLGKLLTMPWQTMNSIVKEALIDGQPAPDGVKVYLKTSFRLRGGNANEE